MKSRRAIDDLLFTPESYKNQIGDTIPISELRTFPLDSCQKNDFGNGYRVPFFQSMTLPERIRIKPLSPPSSLETPTTVFSPDFIVSWVSMSVVARTGFAPG